MSRDSGPALILVWEDRIGSVTEKAGGGRYEASGVCLQDGWLHIVFDNRPRLLRIRTDWQDPGPGPVLVDLEGSGPGYEDIAYDPAADRFYCLIEAAETAPGTFMPRVDAFDRSYAFRGSSWLDFPLKAGNKGFEGLAALRHGGREYLLGLCEGNACRGGSAGRKPGKGRIQVFCRTAGGWEHTGTLRLPETVQFRDYAGLGIRGGTLAVVSQSSSALWAGHLRAGPDAEDEPFTGAGQVYLFPRDDRGRIIYGNVEGVAWLTDDLVAVVSDRAKGSQPGRFAQKDQSVHLFRLPAGGDPRA